MYQLMYQLTLLKIHGQSCTRQKTSMAIYQKQQVITWEAIQQVRKLQWFLDSQHILKINLKMVEYIQLHLLKITGLQSILQQLLNQVHILTGEKAQILQLFLPEQVNRLHRIIKQDHQHVLRVLKWKNQPRLLLMVMWMQLFHLQHWIWMETLQITIRQLYVLLINLALQHQKVHLHSKKIKMGKLYLHGLTQINTQEKMVLLLIHIAILQLLLMMAWTVLYL